MISGNKYKLNFASNYKQVDYFMNILLCQFFKVSCSTTVALI